MQISFSNLSTVSSAFTSYCAQLLLKAIPLLQAEPSIPGLLCFGELLDALPFFKPPLDSEVLRQVEVAAARAVLCLLKTEQLEAHRVIRNSFALVDLHDHLMHSLATAAWSLDAPATNDRDICFSPSASFRHG